MLDGTKVQTILTITGSKTRSLLAEKGYQISDRPDRFIQTCVRYPGVAKAATHHQIKLSYTWGDQHSLRAAGKFMTV